MSRPTSSGKYGDRLLQLKREEYSLTQGIIVENARLHATIDARNKKIDKLRRKLDKMTIEFREFQKQNEQLGKKIRLEVWKSQKRVETLDAQKAQIEELQGKLAAKMKEIEEGQTVSQQQSQKLLDMENKMNEEISEFKAKLEISEAENVQKAQEIESLNKKISVLGGKHERDRTTLLQQLRKQVVNSVIQTFQVETNSSSGDSNVEGDQQRVEDNDGTQSGADNLDNPIKLEGQQSPSAEPPMVTPPSPIPAVGTIKIEPVVDSSLSDEDSRDINMEHLADEYEYGTCRNHLETLISAQNSDSNEHDGEVRDSLEGANPAARERVSAEVQWRDDEIPCEMPERDTSSSPQIERTSPSSAPTVLADEQKFSEDINTYVELIDEVSDDYQSDVQHENSWHVTKANGEESFLCVCGKSFTSNNSRKMHIYMYTPRICKRCGAGPMFYYPFLAHLKQVHGELVKGKIVCHSCGLVFGDRSQFRIHQVNHHTSSSNQQC